MADTNKGIVLGLALAAAAVVCGRLRAAQRSLWSDLANLKLLQGPAPGRD